MSLQKSDDGCHSQRVEHPQPTSRRKQNKRQQKMPGNWIYSWQWCFSKIHRPFFHSWYSYEWTSGQKPQLIKDGRRVKWNTANYAPIVVPGLSTRSLSSPKLASLTSLPQEAAIPSLHPASTRSESASSTVRVSPSHEPADTRKNQKWRQQECTEKPVAWSG